MSTDRDVTRIVRSWLEEGVTALPDRVLDTVLDQLPATPQRRAWWPARRFDALNTSIRLALTAAAAVAVVAVVGVMFWPRSGGVAAPGPTPSPSAAPSPSPSAAPSPSPSAAPSPSPSATVQLLGDGTLQAGPVLATGEGQSGTKSVRFTVPAGWSGFAGTCILPETVPTGIYGICFEKVDGGLFSDPCHGSTGLPDVAVGPTVDALATALGTQKTYTATKPVDITLGGYAGKQMDLLLPTDVASCNDGHFTPWAGSIYAQGPDDHWRLWILDVAGDRLIVKANWSAAASAAELAQVQAIVDSIQIEP